MDNISQNLPDVFHLVSGCRSCKAAAQRKILHRIIKSAQRNIGCSLGLHRSGPVRSGLVWLPQDNQERLVTAGRHQLQRSAYCQHFQTELLVQRRASAVTSLSPARSSLTFDTDSVFVSAA